MFTGMVDHVGEITEIIDNTLKISSEFNEFIVGESIAVNGICLTVINYTTHYFECELSPETKAVSTAKFFKTGSRVNLEKSLTLSDRMGGHMVMGHVDTCAQVVLSEKHGEFIKLGFKPELNQYFNLNYIVQKGSVSLNGVSLTVNDVNKQTNYFDIMLIPHTLLRTNLGDLRVGDNVNLEVDYMGRYIINYLERLTITL